MKLEQNQLWRTHPDAHSDAGRPVFLRIVRLDRLTVAYKESGEPEAIDGRHKETSKKTFCRMIRNGQLVTAG